MSESLNIESLLETGYFKSSRAKSVQPSSQPIFAPPRAPRAAQYGSDDERVPKPATAKPAGPRPQHFRPPPPSVEDEAVSLAREYGAPSVTSSSEEDPQSRGDIDQQPLMMEVHEYNPERRFVIVPDGPNDSKSPEKSRETRAGNDRQRESTLDEPGDGKERRPNLQRQRSRQDLPPIRTDMRHDRASEHQRAQSAAIGKRPNDLPRGSERGRDDLLSPEAVKYSSSRREKSYYDYDTPKSTRRRRSTNAADDRRSTGADDRRRGPSSRRDSLSPVPRPRRGSKGESRKPRRPVSIESSRESRYKEEPVVARSDRRGEPPVRRADDGVAQSAPPTKKREPGARREQSRSSDEGLPERRRRRPTTSIHQDVHPAPNVDKENASSANTRSNPRVVPVPIPIPIPTSDVKIRTGDATADPRATVNFPIAHEDHPTVPPYPDTDAPPRVPPHSNEPDERRVPKADHLPSASMPEFPAAAPPVHSENGAEDAQALAVTPSAKEREPPFWAATSSESEKEGLREPAKGKYTPLSERRDNGENKELPECKRKTPVAGKLDWLTLPRTDFNICLDCYGGVFANTHYKSHFQPMIRPTDKLIACDFGASPWYRIAWLLTLKYNTSDLRCFIQVSSVATSLKNQPCPGNRKVSANWLTIKDPMKRRAVSNFTVCLHCAKTVEALLPNLRGVFVSLDSRSEPSRSVCSLHYTPQRKRFALYFDTLESTADRALRKNESPNIERLASKLEKLTYVEECREDSPVSDGYWHVMQFLPEFTVCGECFDEVVRPRLNDENIISRNFYMEPQRLAVATCQLYSTRMREVFKKACRRNDPDYLEAKVLERLHVEADIHAKLVKLDRAGHDEAWTEEQVAKLIKEWKRWE